MSTSLAESVPRNNDLKIGSVVQVPNNRSGVVKYIGQVDNKPGVFVGIELLNGSLGRNSGYYKGKKYFEVAVANSGIFFSIESITSLNKPGAQRPMEKSTPRADISRNTRSFSALPSVRRVSLRSGPVGDRNPVRPAVKPVERTQKPVERTTVVKPVSGSPEKLERSERPRSVTSFRSQIEDKNKLLEEYKQQIEEHKQQLEQKDAKLAKIKLQADQQRDELREAISALEEQASENEELFTKEVNYLKNQLAEKDGIIAELKLQSRDTGSDSGVSDDVLTSLKKQVQSLEIQNEDIKSDNKKLQLEITKLTSDFESEMSLLTELHTQELSEKAEEIESLVLKNRQLESKVANSSISSSRSTPFSATSDDSADTEIRKLPIYKPSVVIDASAGREKWCGLCEREGHDSYECPFEV